MYLPAHAWDRRGVKTGGPKADNCRVEKEILKDSG